MKTVHVHARRASAPHLQFSSLTSLVAQANELQSVISKALVQLGEEDDDGQLCKAAVDGLGHLYIKTPDQLRRAIKTPEVLPQLTASVLRGLLLPVVSDVLRREEHGEHWRKIYSEVPKSKMTPMNAPLLRRLEIVRADVTQLSAIDQLSQTFRARLFLILRLPGGAKDDDLSRESEDFPVDSHGRPTFRPSARWYLSQLDFPNGRDIKTLESKVTTAGDDLQVIKRIDGEFFERFELQSFPFDAQDLTITVSANCANEGPVPVEFALLESGGQLGVDNANFAFADVCRTPLALLLSPHTSPTPALSLSTL